MKLVWLVSTLLLPTALIAQNADEDTEGKRLHDSCGEIKIVDCVTTLFTDNPFHIAVGGLAPGNGFAAGPALSFTHHTVPKKAERPDGKTTSAWRFNWDVDAVASSNASWRAGAYLTAHYSVEHPLRVVQGRPPKHLDLRPSSWLIRAYIENDALKRLPLYGLGAGSSRSSLTTYAMNEAVAGANVTTPSSTLVHLTGFAEANLRVVSLSNPIGPLAVERIVRPLTAAQGYGQFAEGVRIQPSLGRVQFDYSGKLREFAAPGSRYSFGQVAVDLNQTLGLYRRSAPIREFNGPDSCDATEGRRRCPRTEMSKNLEGSVGFRFRLTESLTSGNDSVPFYFQPTIGGGDINGENTLASYADYRYRAPNLMLLRGSFEHSLGKLPVGVKFLADAGKISRTHDLATGPWVHSFAVGLTLHAGGLPVLSFLFAWGGGEGTHILAQVNNSLLGGSARPSLE